MVWASTHLCRGAEQPWQLVPPIVTTAATAFPCVDAGSGQGWPAHKDVPAQRQWGQVVALPGVPRPLQVAMNWPGGAEGWQVPGGAASQMLELFCSAPFPIDLSSNCFHQLFSSPVCPTSGANNSYYWQKPLLKTKAPVGYQEPHFLFFVLDSRFHGWRWIREALKTGENQLCIHLNAATSNVNIILKYTDKGNS